MRSFSAVGLLLVVLGVLALMIRSVTYFTHEAVAGPLGFFAWDVSQPHTIFLNPMAGLIALVVGVLLLAMPGRQAAM